ncbi:NADPH:quinone reductase-like Zn-dependent oxidoreductase [Paenibacillus sp. DS2015]|uniref:medium chain dehydrogenase/reductase family protein n=1 Tax=Paenibacillus sp. DS2015 TaxID=3373917 RepID=UPI003D1C7407
MEVQSSYNTKNRSTKENTMTKQLSSSVVHTTEIVLPGIVEPSGLQIRQRVLPELVQGQALISVEATGVSFAEKSMRRGRYYGQPSFPFVLGYDLVGTVTTVGPNASPAEVSLIGRRVAAITKIGGWASHVILEVADLVEVPVEIDAISAETVIVNGVTAWQMLHRHAKVKSGQTILVLGANSGVGTTLVQLARHAGVRVIGTANPHHHEALRKLGVEPLDYRNPQLEENIRSLAPNGVDAVFDHLGGASVKRSWRLLATGGALVCYGMATMKETGSLMLVSLPVFAKLALWNALPNGRRATFYNIWGGARRKEAWRNRMQEDLRQVLTFVQKGIIEPQVAARFPLTQAARAMELSESRTVLGKVILEP